MTTALNKRRLLNVCKNKQNANNKSNLGLLGDDINIINGLLSKWNDTKHKKEEREKKRQKFFELKINRNDYLGHDKANEKSHQKNSFGNFSNGAAFESINNRKVFSTISFLFVRFSLFAIF